MASRPERVAPVLLALMLMAAVGLDVFRIGFFADDFHFLDVARRIPLFQLLSGQHGMWPWFRPLSRELYFWIVVRAGPASLAMAHGLSLACLFGCAWLLWRLGRDLVGAAPAAIGVALFLTYDFTKFLAAWASGFQDLLALLFMLLALRALLDGRRGIALGWAILAPFAKESGFVIFPLLLAGDYLCVSRRFDRRWVARVSSACGIVAIIHVLARLAWHTAGGTGRTELAPQRLPVVLGEATGGFVTLPSGLGGWAVATAGLAGLCAALWLISLAPPGTLREPPEARPAALPGTRFAAIAAALGVAPVVVGHLSSLTFAHAYHVFSAVPWMAMLLGIAITRLPDAAWRSTVPVLVALNVWGLGFRPPDLDRLDGWQFHRWDWREAVRFSAVARRLGDDVRVQLAARPGGLIVLYEDMPPGCFFQTEDGPATREVLGDPSVRAFWVNDPPSVVTRDRLAILAFDDDRLHLVHSHWSSSTAIFRAMNAIMARRGRAANAFAIYEESPDSARFDRAYLRAAASLLEEGPGGFVRSLAGAGLSDTLGAEPATLAAPVADVDRHLGAALAEMLAHPRSAAAHLALADSLLARGVLPRAGLELRIAVTLDPSRFGDRYRLAHLMAGLGGSVEALAELREIAADPSAGLIAAETRQAIARLERGERHVRP